ncbi:MAG: rod shape-determining protein RodA [Chloroflexi bacterium]|nr:rod shape-determining protein RodA [Chloroflexota bacterium]
MLSAPTGFLRKFDFVLMAAVTLLILLGIMMIASATRDVASLADRTRSQILFSIVGLAIVLIFSIIDYRLWTSTYLWIYGGLVLFLALGTLLGVEGEAGSQSWINLGIAGFQPSELAKILLIIVLAQQLAVNADRIESLGTIIVSLIFVSIPAFLIFIQPDLGITVLIMAVWFVMVWFAGLRWEHVALFVVVGLVMSPVIWTQMEDYQRARITTFIDLDSDPDQAFNIRQALTAVGNGSVNGTTVFGRGYMQGSQTQLRFLRVRHTDFIFAVIAEELGFVGAGAVLFLMGVVIFRIVRAGSLAPDMAGALICYGVAMVIFFQTLVSIGMNVRLLPVTGLTLPFVSSGGSSLVTLLMGIGLVQSVLLRQDPREALTTGGTIGNGGYGLSTAARLQLESSRSLQQR